VYLNYNQASAKGTCEAYGMQLYKYNYPVDETALLAWADSQWPKNRLWVNGGDGTLCNMVSNLNGGTFVTTKEPCTTTLNYFYCEYKSELNFYPIFF
jgi:hypothetical protein